MVSAPMLPSVCLAAAFLVAAGVALDARTLTQVLESDDELYYDDEVPEPDDDEVLQPQLNGSLLFDTLSMYASKQMEKFDALRLLNRGGQPNISLLTTIFLKPLDAERSHEREVLAAFATNVQNPFISTIHVLLETKRDDNCSGLRGLLENAISTYQNRSLTQYHKVNCVQMFERPLYGYFFKYANRSFPAGTEVMITNADVVYDETLAQLPPLETGGVHLMSVRPPPYDGAFKDTFHRSCGGKDAGGCTTKGAKGWDAYVFRTPLPARLNGFHLNFPMSWKASEYYMAGALSLSGMKLTNPCMFVHAYHWHCFGHKMHSPLDTGHHHRPNWRQYHSFPCQDFPQAPDCKVTKDFPQAPGQDFPQAPGTQHKGKGHRAYAN